MIEDTEQTTPATASSFGIARKANAKKTFMISRLIFAMTVIGVLTLSSTFRYRDVDPAFLMEATALVEERELKKRTQTATKKKRRKEKKKLRRALRSQVIVTPDDADDNYEVHFLNRTQLAHLDGFSASWLQRKEDFMTMNFDKIGICEDAAFQAYSPSSRQDKMRMTLDWLDFGVEHMSKWFKLLRWDAKDNPIPYEQIIKKFTAYMDGASYFTLVQQQHDNSEQPLLRETLAVIAFQSYRHGSRKDMAHNLTVASLAATVESLRRAGFGRVVVSIMIEADFDMTQDAFLYLLDRVEPGHAISSSGVVTKIGHMEVGWAIAKSEHAKTRFVAKNMPRATLLGLKEAFEASEMDKDQRDEIKTKEMTSWLGDIHNATYWKYIYLTEPDTILQAKPKALSALKDELDKGGVIMPHRLQPIPHASDLPGMSNDKNLFLDGDDFSSVLELNSSTDACCDENAGPNFKPGLPPYFEKCETFWYMCGLGPKKKDREQGHDRLKPYKLMRLNQGTGIVSLAGSEHGRRCVVKKNAVCKPFEQS